MILVFGTQSILCEVWCWESSAEASHPGPVVARCALVNGPVVVLYCRAWSFACANEALQNGEFKRFFVFVLFFVQS